MKADSLTLSYRAVRKSLDMGEKYLHIIRDLRRKGRPFKVARDMVRETQERAPWLRCFWTPSQRAMDAKGAA